MFSYLRDFVIKIFKNVKPQHTKGAYTNILANAIS